MKPRTEPEQARSRVTQWYETIPLGKSLVEGIADIARESIQKGGVGLHELQRLVSSNAAKTELAQRLDETIEAGFEEFNGRQQPTATHTLPAMDASIITEISIHLPELEEGKPFSAFLREFIQENCFGADGEKSIALESLKNEVEAAREMILEALLFCAKTTVTRIYKEYLSGPKKDARIIQRHIGELVTRVVNHADSRHALNLAIEDLMEEGIPEYIIETELENQLLEHERDDLAALVVESINDMTHARVERMTKIFFPMGIKGHSHHEPGNGDSHKAQKPIGPSPKPFVSRPPKRSSRKKRKESRIEPQE